MALSPARTSAQSAAVELTADRAFARRVVRLAVTSAIALGVLWALARDVDEAHPSVGYLLAAGWVLMPTVLLASLAHPRLRYLLVVPSTLVTVALAVVCVIVVSRDGMAAAGWMLVTAGVLMGGGMGLWFWYRLLPVPALLGDPFSPGRWTLVVIHVLFVLGGMAMVAATG